MFNWLVKLSYEFSLEWKKALLSRSCLDHLKDLFGEGAWGGGLAQIVWVMFKGGVVLGQDP